MASASHPAGKNQILAALSREALERILPHLERVPMPLDTILYEAGDPVSYVYFPTDCIVSLLTVTENGASAEISVVGHEGLVGISLCMGEETAFCRALIQSSGSGYRLSARKFMEEFHRHGELMRMALRYTQVLITQMTQTAVCNRHHTIKQQLCRWLLLSLDRLPSNDLVMTQEVIATMLGVRREGVTEAAGNLQKLGAIKYRRGHIQILDRPALEEMTCECYGVVKRETDRLLKPDDPVRPL